MIIIIIIIIIIIKNEKQTMFNYENQIMFCWRSKKLTLGKFFSPKSTIRQSYFTFQGNKKKQKRRKTKSQIMNEGNDERRTLSNFYSHYSFALRNPFSCIW